MKNYTFAQLVDRVKTRLKDAEYSEEDIKEFINDAYFEVLGEDRYTFNEKIYKATSTGSSELYVPSDYASLIHFTATDKNGRTTLKYKAPRDYFDSPKDSANNYYCYTVFGEHLIYSLPTISEEMVTDEDFYALNLYYLAKPLLLLNDNDKPVIPREYSEIVVLGALARAEQLRDNFDYAQIYENKKEDLVINMKQRYCPRQMDCGNRAKLPLSIKNRW